MESKNGKELQKLAETARENEQYLDSLELTDEAIIAFEKDHDLAGLAEVLAARALTLRHLFRETKDKAFLILALGQALTAVEIAKKSKIKEALSVPLFELAAAQEDAGKLTKAILNYREAIETLQNNASKNDNKAVLENIKVHLEACRYKAGDKEALEKAEKATSELEESKEPNKFYKDVWVSGAYLRLSKILRQDDPQKSRIYCDRAMEIIHANPDLKIRRKQLAEVDETFKHSVHQFTHI